MIAHIHVFSVTEKNKKSVLLLLLLLLQPFKDRFSRITWVSRYQKDETSQGFKWGKRWRGFGIQRHQLDHLQTMCTSFQRDNNSSLNFYRPDPLRNAQPKVSKHWRRMHCVLHAQRVRYCVRITVEPVLWVRPGLEVGRYETVCHTGTSLDG